MTGELLGLGATQALPDSHPAVLALRASFGGEAPPPAPLDPSVLRGALAALEADALRAYEEADLSSDIAHASLVDVGRKVDAYGASVDTGWLLEVMRGDVIALGRLQYERGGGATRRAIHIPEGDPLSPDSVDDSLARAVRHFGERRFRCTSWLLDPRLERLGGGNLVAFARRFHVAPAEPTLDADRAVVKFVFRRPLEAVFDAAQVQPATRLERLVAEVLRSGEHWTEPTGVLEYGRS